MYVARPLGQDHNLEAFDCGKEELNRWLSASAWHATKNNTARTFVWTPESSTDVIAYYSLAGHAIEKGAVPSKVGRGSPNQIPAVMLARLALDKQLQGQGLGKRLLVEALSRIVDASRHVAARMVIVDAIDDEAAAFYTKYGFTRVPGDMRFVRKLSDIERDLAS